MISIITYRLRLYYLGLHVFATMRPGQNGRHFQTPCSNAFLQSECMNLELAINNLPGLVQVMAWRQRRQMMHRMVHREIKWEWKNWWSPARNRYHDSRDRITIAPLLWRHQKSIVVSSAERRPSEWDTGTMCKDRRFYRHLWIRYVV